MYAIFKNAFRKYFGQILGWGISLAAMGGFLMAFYDTLAADSGPLMEMVNKYPPAMMALFGDMTQLFTPTGYLHTEFFSYMPIILGIFSSLAGAALVAGDEESGVLDLVMSMPVSRTKFFAGRLLAYAAATLSILFITWTGFILVEPSTSMDIGPVEMARPFLSLFSILMVFGSLAMLLSMVLPSVTLSASISATLLIMFFFLSSFSRINPELETAAKLSPLNYYQGGDALSGLKVEWFFVLLGISSLMILLALWRFNARDIRVGGEGGWGFRNWLKKPAMKEG